MTGTSAGDDSRMPMWLLIDALRRMQGVVLEGLGFGPSECPYRLLASDACWRLRQYTGGDGGPPVLIVAAPIKQPYIWDLAAPLSVIAHCQKNGFRIFLIEWTPPAPGDVGAGLADYSAQFLGDAVDCVRRAAGGAKPFLMGHSLGGTLAAMSAAFHSRNLCGLVLLGAPLCFAPRSSRLRDAIVSMVPSTFSGTDIVPGSWLSQLCTCACPETFVWERMTDAAFSMSDPQAWAILARVERWALDEIPLSGRLVQEILEWLFFENRLCRGTLSIKNRTVGPLTLELPTLMVVNTEDEVSPPSSVRPVADAMPAGRVSLIEHPGDLGVGLQHLAILVGRRARATVWPQVISWLRAQV